MSKNFSITLVQCPCWQTDSPPITMSLLAGSLRSQGFKVHLFDMNIDFLHMVSDEHKSLWVQGEHTFWSSEDCVNNLMEEYSDKIDKLITQIILAGSQMVGFTLYFTTINFTLGIITRLKRRSPDTIVVLGGPSTAEYGSGLELLKIPTIDAIVLREGDITLPEMCRVLKDKGHLDKIPGLVFKEGGQIKNGGLRKPVTSLDSIPYSDYSDFDLTRYKMPERLNIFSSRSCINKCHFCEERKFFGHFRVRSGKSLFEEVQHHLSLFPNVKFFGFNDSIMNASLKTLRKFSELLLKNHTKILWGGQGIIRKDMTPELFGLMASAGCYYIGYGIESGSEDVRKSMNKNFFTNELADKVIRATFESGIKAGNHFMFGYPTETEEDFQMTLDFLRRNHKWIAETHPSSFFTVFFPNTYLTEHSVEFGVAPNMHPVFWQTTDGKNTYPVRLDRYERFCKLCIELGISGPEVKEELPDKWKLLGDYYRHKKDYNKASECYKKDSVTRNYSPETLKLYSEDVNNSEEFDLSGIYIHRNK